MAPPEASLDHDSAGRSKTSSPDKKPEKLEEVYLVEGVEPASERPYQHPHWYAKLNVHEKSLEDQANCVSDWCLQYLSPLLRLGALKVLDQNDIGAPSEQDRASLTFNLMRKEWKIQLDKTEETNVKRKAKYDARLSKMSSKKRLKAKPFVESEASIGMALITAFGGWRIAFAILIYVISALVQFVPVIILNDLVKYFETVDTINPHTTIAHPWIEVVGLGLFPLISTVCQTRSQVIFQHAAVFVRTAISTLLYEKSLNVSAVGKAASSTGQVVNMMSNDTTQIQRFIQFGGMILVSPIQIVVALVLIYRQVGAATWVGVGFMVALAPVNVVVFSVVSKMRRKVLKYSDLRVKMMNEILAGIRIIKFYAWEKPFKKEVGQLRDKELRALTNLSYVSAVGFSMILMSAPIIQPILVFLTYINIQDDPLTASTAFTTVALFNIMRFPFAFLPMGLLQYIQSSIAVNRLGKYMQLPELSKYVISEPHPDDKDDPSAPGSQSGSITMNDASFSWTNRGLNLKPIESGQKSKKKERRDSASSQGSNASSGRPSLSVKNSRHGNVNPEDPLSDVETLRNLNITIESGELIAIVGTVGSGKSSFLSAILGEMEPLNDSKVYIPRGADMTNDGKFISYCCQTPWVVNDTLRGNILFGREFDEERYDEVLEACALRDDLTVLPAGDQTEIGERGINLSGGQKARVSLARALYSKCSKLLLLDDPLSAVDSHVGEHLFKNAIIGDVCEGSTRILVTHHVHFLPRCDKVIVLEGGEIKHYGKYESLIEQGVDFAGAVDFDEQDTSEKSPATEDGDAEKAAEKVEKKVDSGEDLKKKAEMKKKGEKLTTTEEREEGSVEAAAYSKYANAGGFFLFFSAFLSQGIGRASEVGSSFWLAYWAKESIMAEVAVAGGASRSDFNSSTWYLNIYAAFGIGGVLCLTIRALVMAVHRLYASKKLHEDLVSNIMRAPVSFHDVTPVGRVLNRFAADMDKIDLDLTQSIAQGMSTIFSVLGALGAIIAATKGTFLIPLLPIGYIYYIIQKWFRKTSTELQRVTSIAGSPIFADFSQVLTGTSTIRAYGEKTRFFAQCQKSFDNYNASFNLVYMANFWLGLRLDFLGGLIGSFIGGVAVATAESNFIPAGWLALALSYSIEMTGYLKHGVRMIATIEADMNSVERVLYYSENVEAEAPDIIPESDPKPGTWPSAGVIEIENASMRYRDGPLVLKNIGVKFRGGEKVGVVGRTGSGKSSLMNLMFRITELENDGGIIKIDDVDTSKIGTEVLRLNLSIIPQDPVMFSNTVRYNIDPFGNTTESEIWDVIEKVQLTDVISGLPDGLDDQVAEGGENFSQGQRQLLCIARSLLRKPKILIMDEATASIDNSTDATIQQMIRENFKDATVLTIAHRLNTILDSDRILVLDDGNVAEFDTPNNLLAKRNGIFRGMVDKSRSVKG